MHDEDGLRDETTDRKVIATIIQPWPVRTFTLQAKNVWTDIAMMPCKTLS